MMQEILYDIAIIGWWASGIFTAIHSPKNAKKIILEKTGKLGTKVLLSGGERCNVSNRDLNPEENYFGKNKKALLSLFKKFSNYDMISWLEERGIETHIEDRGRIILKSGKSQDLIEIFQRELQKNSVEIRKNFPVESVEKVRDIFHIISGQEIICAKKVVVATGGKSFAQVGTDGWGYTLAKTLGLEVVAPYKWLCGMITREDLSEISGSTIFLEMQIFDDEKQIGSETWAFLFTHFWLSGPIVFNGVLKIGEHLRNKNIEGEEETPYIREHLSIKLIFTAENLTKRVEKFFGLSEEKMEVILHPNDFRSWSEAKVTGGGVLLDELTNTFESKKIPGMYFIGEVVDITGKTGGFNLQSMWSQWYVVGKSLCQEMSLR